MVVDRVQARLVRAAVSVCLAAIGSTSLSGRIIHIVAVAVAVVAVKRVNQVAPVADLVDRDLAGAVDGAAAGRDAAGGCPGAHDTAVIDEGIAAVIRADGVLAETRVTVANVADVVEVESAVVALAERLLHAVLVVVVCPVAVDGPVGVL